MRIGIIGGGQLGMMMAEAAKKYDMEVVGLDPSRNCPLSTVADKMIIGKYDDAGLFKKIIDDVDVVTYEFENVNLDLVKTFEKHIPQKAAGLYFSRNRLTEKKYVRKLGIPTPNFQKYTKNYVFTSPVIIKTTEGGYDGKGQYVIKNENDLKQFKKVCSIEYIVEELVPFDYEISVIVSRDKKDKVVCYPIPVNTHVDGILYTSKVDNEIPKEIKEMANKHTVALIKKLDYVGTLAVEYFVVGNKVIFNEFAPRPHNSGHYSIEGCSISQFENHIRAITGMDVLEPELVYPSLMINVLGQDVSRLKTNYGNDVFIHDYQKLESKHNRKMGHLTIVHSDVSKLNTIKNEIVEERI